MSGRLSRLREDLRQRRHHRAFRIAPLPWDEPSREELERLLATVAASVATAGTAAPDTAVQPPPAEDPLDAKALADAATNLWRAQRRLTRQGEAASSRSRQTGRYLRSCREALDDAGLLVQEHEGDAFHTGRSLEALTFQEDASLTAETVLETIRPTIYLHGRRIQMGQVIVGCPPAPAPAPALAPALAPAPAPEPEPEPAPEPAPEVTPVSVSASASEPEPGAGSGPARAPVPAPAVESGPAPAPVPAPAPGPEDAVPASAHAPAPARETPCSSDHERTDHA
ncbi:hypothetical protein SSPS47_18140 [Streptomyces sp. S4.7]|uniref:hypothetical protein n=1 Tax=Streptomyces sp. S4.7 TaxID=2705439 RepID=UPI001399689D|nr:hypothetical protein [Streptomyces sp. S4.7]QHY97028.1 hypothetical protein SSPS47_18140 [Streptomyces sp. S4.7]